MYEFASFLFVICPLIFSFILLWLKDTISFQFLKNILILVLCPNIWHVLENVPCTIEKRGHCTVVRAAAMSVGSSDFPGPFMSSTCLPIFCLDVLSISKVINWSLRQPPWTWLFFNAATWLHVFGGLCYLVHTQLYKSFINIWCLYLFFPMKNLVLFAQIQTESAACLHLLLAVLGLKSLLWGSGRGTEALQSRWARSALHHRSTSNRLGSWNHSESPLGSI